MTTETFPLPSTYTYGKVVGRVIYAIADTGEDADDKPQARAAAGTVTFTPMATGAKVTTADYTAIVMNGQVKANLSSSGRILDGEGRQGIWLIVGVYRVDFTFDTTSDGLKGTLPPFQIEVTDAHTELAPLDLASAAPASVPEGAVVQTVILPTGSGIVSRNAVTGAIEYLDPDDLGGGATELADLTDVDAAGAATGQALVKTAGGYGFGTVASTWDALSGKPAVIAAGADAAAARSAIGAASTATATTGAAGLVQLAGSGDTTSTSKAMTPALVKALIDVVVGGAPGALDTLNKLAAALGSDAAFSSTVGAALAARVRTDTAAQGLTDTQKSNARTNIGAATAADISSLYVWKYSSGAYPSLPTSQPAGVLLVQAIGPTEPGSGSIPSWIGLGTGQVPLIYDTVALS